MDLEMVKIEVLRSLAYGFAFLVAYKAGKIMRGNKLQLGSGRTFFGVLFLAEVAFVGWLVTAGAMEASGAKDRVTMVAIVCFVIAAFSFSETPRGRE